MTDRLLVAGVGNVFRGDDGFGVEVVRAMEGHPLPDGVVVADFGIGGVHLAYELLEGYAGLILVDATARGGAPGTIYLIEPDAADDAQDPLAAPMDAHEMGPDAVLALVRSLGARLGHSLEWIRVLGCEPSVTDEVVGLSPAVSAAVPKAVAMVLDLAAAPRTAAAVQKGSDVDDRDGEGRRAGDGDGIGGALVAGHRPLREDAGDVTVGLVVGSGEGCR